MELSVKEAAALLGTSARTVRNMARDGRITARRDGNRWRIDRASLVTADAGQAEARTAQVAAVKAQLSDALDKLTPSTHPARKRGFYSVRDVAAFRAGAEVLAALDGRDQAALVPARARLEETLRLLADGVHQYHPELKIERFVAARTAACRTLTALIVAQARSETADLDDLADTVERDLLGALRGLIRTAERRARRQ